MPDYRIFCMNAAGHIHRATIVTVETDAEALTAAISQLNDHAAVEVWHLSRMVGRLDGRIPRTAQGSVAWPPGDARGP